MEKLGLDIPPPPEVTLEEITAREIRIAWKQPEFHNSIHKHIIQVNNVKGMPVLDSPLVSRREVLRIYSGRVETSGNGRGNLEPCSR